MTSWFRSWHGAPTDNKWLVIAAKAKVKPGIVSAVAWALFDYASQAEDRGSVKEFDTETYAVFSGFSENEVQAVVAAMCTKGIIGEDWRLAAWDKRQPKREDDSAERVRRHRKNQRDGVTTEQKYDVTQCNAEKRNVTHGNNTEPDTDTEKKQTTTSAAPVTRPTKNEVVVVDDPARYRHACDLIHQNGFGMMTPILAEQVHTMLAEYPDEWIDKAFEVSVKANKRRLDYAIGVLENWRRNGFDSRQAKAPPLPPANGIVAGFSLDEMLGNGAPA